MTKELLELCPVWGAFDDDDSEIVRPVIAADPFSLDCDPLTIAASIETAGGSKLFGCVVLDRAFNEVFLVELFVDGKCIGFNNSLPGIAEKQMSALRICINEPEKPIFPLRYETQTIGPDGNRICGVFSPFS